MAQALVDGNIPLDNGRKRPKKQPHSSTPKKKSKKDKKAYLPSEYYISIKDEARIIVRASKKAKDGVEIKLMVSEKKNEDILDYSTWLEAVKLTNVVAMARDQILEHNPPVKSASTKTTNTTTQASLSNDQYPGRRSPSSSFSTTTTPSPDGLIGSYIDQLEDLEELKRQLDQLN